MTEQASNDMKLILLYLILTYVFLTTACAPKTLITTNIGTEATKACINAPQGSHATYFFGEYNSVCSLQTPNMVDFSKNSLSIFDPTYFMNVHEFINTTYIPTTGDVAIIDICQTDSRNGTDIDYYKSQMTNIIQTVQYSGMRVYVANCRSNDNIQYSQAIESIVSTLNLPRVSVLKTY